MLLLLVRNGVREILNHSLRVLFCISPPSYCVHGQFLIDKSLIRNFWSTAGGAGGAAPCSHRSKSHTTPELLIPFARQTLRRQIRSCSSCSCFVRTQERVLRPLDLSHLGPKNFFKITSQGTPASFASYLTNPC